MTDVHCARKECLNNCKGWCKANGIHVSSHGCQSYCTYGDTSRPKGVCLSKRHGRYKQGPKALK